MKNRILFTIVLLSVIFASCKRCVPEGPFVHLYLKNESTHNVVVEHQGVGAIGLVAGQKSKVNYGDYFHAPLPEDGFFWRMYVNADTATFTFDDGTVWKHYYITTDTTVLPYERLFVPSEGNIWEYSSWKTTDERSYTYTITEEDYQRALEQSKTLKANLSDNTTAAQIDELLDNYINLGF